MANASCSGRVRIAFPALVLGAAVGIVAACQARPRAGFETGLDAEAPPDASASAPPATAPPPVSPPGPWASCHTPLSSDRPVYDDGEVWHWTNGVTDESHAACVFVPPASDPSSKRPLVVFLGWYGFDDVYASTSLRTKAEAFPLSNDGSRPGFVLASDLPIPLGGRATWEFEDRGFASGCTNDAFRALDDIIDHLAATGVVDTKAIYVVGWLMGATLAHGYAIERHEHPTPAGHRVAAAVTYAGRDPYGDHSPIQPDWPARHLWPPCALTPPPKTSLPLLVIGPSCDANPPCDAAQAEKFRQAPGSDTTSWTERLVREMGDGNARRLLLDPTHSGPASTCAPAAACDLYFTGLVWPDGATRGVDHEPAMLDFLARNPLP
jgi:hypothetical protein